MDYRTVSRVLPSIFIPIFVWRLCRLILSVRALIDSYLCETGEERARQENSARDDARKLKKQ